MKLEEKTKLRAMDKTQLQKVLLEKQKEIQTQEMELRMGLTVRRMYNRGDKKLHVKRTRKEMAVIKTIMNEKWTYTARYARRTWGMRGVMLERNAVNNAERNTVQAWVNYTKRTSWW